MNLAMLPFQVESISDAKEIMLTGAKAAVGRLPNHASWSWRMHGLVLKLQLQMEGQVVLTKGSWNSVTGAGWYEGCGEALAG